MAEPCKHPAAYTMRGHSTAGWLLSRVCQSGCTGNLCVVCCCVACIIRCHREVVVTLPDALAVAWAWLPWKSAAHHSALRFMVSAGWQPLLTAAVALPPKLTAAHRTSMFQSTVRHDSAAASFKAAKLGAGAAVSQRNGGMSGQSMPTPHASGLTCRCHLLGCNSHGAHSLAGNSAAAGGEARSRLASPELTGLTACWRWSTRSRPVSCMC